MEHEIKPDLIVHGIEGEIVEALGARAKANGRSAEAELREILAAVLKAPRSKNFAAMLAAMPEAGCDEDFARVQSSKVAPGVFD